MKRVLCFLLMGLIVLNLNNCASRQASPAGEEDVQADDSGGEVAADSGDATSEDSTIEDSANADSNSENSTSDSDQALSDNEPTVEAKDTVAETPSENSSSSDPFAEEPTAPTAQSEKKPEPADEMSGFPEEKVTKPNPPPAIAQSEDPFESTPSTPPKSFQSESIVSTPTPVTPEVSQPVTNSGSTFGGGGGGFAPVAISDLKYMANDGGGTLVIEGNGPLTFTTRQNDATNQYVIEVANANLPERLKRSLNTKEIQGAIGAIDAYQASNNSARFVIQLRDGAAFPSVQQEGNRILVVSDLSASNAISAQDSLNGGGAVNSVFDDRILKNQSLDEFLVSNTQFFGGKISIEMNDMEVKDALRFITEESGANIVISDDIKGKLTLKLRQVPWDQALVVIMKAKQLGYARSGNVIRIAQLKDLKQEEADSMAIAQERKANEPLKVKVVAVNYANIKDIEEKIKPFLTKNRGQVIGDARTNMIVITDTEEALQRLDKLIRSLDTQPPQVLIEGKIVEAAESFQRLVGINWGMSGTPINLAKSGKYGPINMAPSLTVNPLNSAGAAGGMGFNLNIGTMDIIGDLSAALSLSEREDKIKVISSPRVVTLSNESADISQTTKVPMKKVDVTATGSTTTTTYESLQLRLQVTPQITSDSSIIMKIAVKRDVPGATNVADGSFPINSREANSKVMVRNGQTAVIGGIYQSDVTESESGVPYLKDIPLFGALFKGRATTKEKRELLIFMTPRILGLTDTQAVRGE